MPSVQRFADLLHDLRQLERAAAGSHGRLILDAFGRHTSFGAGAVYLREAGAPMMRLAATSRCVAPDVIDGEPPRDLTVSHALPLDPLPDVIVPIHTHRDPVGLVALSKGNGGVSDDEMEMLRAAEAFLATVMANHRLQAEAREGDFQLKYRLWELESLYDIGLSIAGTLNIEELADEILFRMISLTNSRRAALFLREGDRFRLYRSFGEVREEFLNQDLAAQLVREGAPLSFQENTDCIFPGCCAYVAVPIRGNNSVIGVLAAADRETREGGIGGFEANDLRLLSLFASQVAIALENARLHREALEKQAMQRDLELAVTIQRDILPKSVPSVPGIELATLSRPARQLGGDYHAFFERDGILTIVVADVAGKSLPAALLVSAFHAAIQLLFAEGRDLAEIATELNKHIHRWSAENKFVTMIMVSIDRELETIEFVNAGHNPSYVVRDGEIDVLRSHGLPIGILPQTRYSSQSRPFAPGSLLVLYSDGITEAENVAGEEFENERLEAILAGTATATATAVRDAIASAADAFTTGAPQKDDQTLVVARV